MSPNTFEPLSLSKAVLKAAAREVSNGVKDGPILSQARSRSKGPLSDQVADATKPRDQCRGWVDLTHSPKGIRTAARRRNAADEAGTLGQPPSDVAVAESNRGRQSSGLGSHWSQLPGWGRLPAMVSSLNKALTADRRRRVRCTDQSSSRSSDARGAGHFPGTSGTGPHCGLAAEIRRLGNSEPHRSAPSDIG